MTFWIFYVMKEKFVVFLRFEWKYPSDKIIVECTYIELHSSRWLVNRWLCSRFTFTNPSLVFSVQSTPRDLKLEEMLNLQDEKFFQKFETSTFLKSFCRTYIEDVIFQVDTSLIGILNTLPQVWLENNVQKYGLWGIESYVFEVTESKLKVNFEFLASCKLIICNQLLEIWGKSHQEWNS